MRKLPPLSALKVFEAAARHLHFGRAADELCVTHSAVSHQVRSLETSLGVTLFEKHGRQVRLTDTGLRLLHSVQQALDIMAEACSDAINPGMRGALKISAPAELAHRFFPRILGEFAQRYPGLTLHLLVHDSNSDEINPAADITILYAMADNDWARYWAVPFQALEFFPVCHPGLVEDEGLLTPADLARFCLLHDDQDGKTWATWLGAFAASLPVPTRNLHFAHIGLAVEAALHKAGVCLADTLTTGEELKSGRLIRPFRGAVPSPGNYYLVAERRKREDPRLAAFMSFASLVPYLCESS
jgi:LysR family glycine cleavage system transcriptional activator